MRFIIRNNGLTFIQKLLKINAVVVSLTVTVLISQAYGIVINEFMAANRHFITDEAGQFEDWLELYNETDTIVNVGGYYLTDDLQQPTKWMIPDKVPASTTLQPHSYLLIWLDDDHNQGMLHATFKLNADREQLGLFGNDGNTPIDTLSFSNLSADQSLGRQTDGSANWILFTKPTPKAANSDASEIREFHITCNPDSFRYIYEHPKEDLYIPITFIFAGRTWRSVRMRIRGDSSRELPKKSLKIKFDETPFIDGRDVLNLNADYMDQSYMHSVMASYIMQQTGLPCFNADYARLFLNGTFIGLYITIENIDKAFLERNNLDKNGNLYKAYKDGSCLSIYDDPDYHWEKKTNTESGIEDLKDLINQISTTPDSLFLSFIRGHFFHDQLTTLIANNILLNNGSTYYHNYYMYHDLHNSGRWMMLPWDMDLTFNSYHYKLPYHRTAKPPWSDNMLIERILANDSLRTEIKMKIDDLHSTFLNSTTFSPLVDSIKSLILPSVMADTADKVTDTTDFNVYCEAMRHYFSMRYPVLQEQFQHWPLPFKINTQPQKTGDSLTFTWHPSSDPDNDPVTYVLKYSLQQDLSDSSLTTIHTDITDTFLTLSPSLSEGTWYWTVFASDGPNSTEGYNSFNTFTIYPGRFLPSQPVYHLSIKNEDLVSLFNDPYSDEYHPAILTVNQKEYECAIRFRGATGRNLPKKSFRIKFPDRNNIFGSKAINLNAEYRDRSMMRNHLAMRLFDYRNLPAPHSSFVNVFINRNYAGVYLQIEAINDDFLARYHRRKNAMYKALNHGALMAPVINHEHLVTSWEKKSGSEDDYTDIKQLLNKVYYLSSDDFNQYVTEHFNVEDVLTYFAIQLVLVNTDGMTKNIYFYNNPASEKWELFPWDMDATFGNYCDGEYVEHFAWTFDFDLFDSNVLIQRLFENPKWDKQFIDIVHDITTNGFTIIRREIDSIFPLIRNDILQDASKRGSNEEFLNAVQVLKEFLPERHTHIAQRTSMNRPLFSDYYISDPMPHPTDSGITFRVKSTASAPMYLIYSKDVDLTTSGKPFTQEQLELFDDGNHNDLLAGDSIFGNILAIDKSFPEVVPYAFKSDNYASPPNGLFYQDWVPTKTLAFAPQKKSLAAHEALSIDTIYKMENDYAVLLSNNSSSEINLSSVALRSGEYYNIYHFPSVFTLVAGSTVALVSSRSFRTLFTDIPVLEHLDITFREHDTLTLLSSSLTPIISREILFTPAEISPSQVILFNEINYHSGPEYDAGDWVEFYNPASHAIDISNWYFKDGNDNNDRFTFPANTIIPSEGYIVVCEDRPRFEHCYGDQYPGSPPGEFDFGLSSDGETLRLYDDMDVLVNRMTYESTHPWPPEADGKGYTLSLINGTLDNTAAQNWQSSPTPGGTPGKWNDLDKSIEKRKKFSFDRYRNTIHLFLLTSHTVNINLFSLNGRKVKSIVNRTLTPASYRFNVVPESLGSGYYLLRISIDNKMKALYKVIIVH